VFQTSLDADFHKSSPQNNHLNPHNPANTRLIVGEEKFLKNSNKSITFFCLRTVFRCVLVLCGVGKLLSPHCAALR